MTDLPIIQLRRIEASIIRPIYDELVRELGRDKAREILGRAIIQNAKEQGASLAARDKGKNDMAGFAALLPNWQKEDALQIDVLKQDENEFHFNVTRCRYAEMYRDMGLAEIGALLSCNRDGAMCEGYNPNLKLERSQTIMSGASHCDFRFHMARDGDS